ncbi:1,4-alpha-glucan branching protein GlgB [Marnyiella aurantia]|uniref:1,4-alpha-glucan branching enzyme GlgB n=1 Tax=Marnyiella aurantia TaxID=2758037 RepID=A0A7D7LT04_9FLAO|nr:1,4-alpha-glucan branching protein GlgB [Marnyiella aurantia]MBA5246459.1 1,4-alpha-glucan branching protein GlgB [Marnyiella aurantia]QMS98175.1 1,4-alpha-glucan branching protein GlgB [Marnyiella aurantia]
MQNVHPYSRFTEHDIYLFREGKHYRLYDKFGSHEAELDGKAGTCFSLWAPHAEEVSVIADFNGWDSERHRLLPRWDGSGIWEGFIADVKWGAPYKYGIRTKTGALLEKSDPYALSFEQNVQAASLVSTTWYEWNDSEWMSGRHKNNSLQAPISVYEMHLGSWMRGTEDPERFLSYREIAERLVPYIKEMGFTHVEFMPVMEHPYEPSWGYQITGFFAANSRFGAPQDLMFLIDELHRNNIGVILDWVPSHFPGDANGLHVFDGTYLYEHEDPRQGFHPQWSSYLFNYGRPEVKSFLISNAMFWLDRYHADGLRVDAVTSMLYLDYAREVGEWIPNLFGGNVNLEAKEFLQEFNIAVYREFPEILTIAEESSDFPLLTTPVHDGGIGFGMKWMMGWMHDTLKYFKEDPVNRKYEHNKITFSSAYVFNANYMMPLSHDEVVHGKASMVYKMPGDEWQKFANLRALYAYMFTHPAAKLLFMGNEFAQTAEWKFAASLDWHLLEHNYHKGMQQLVKDLNRLYRNEPALYSSQFDPSGFEWVEANDDANSVFVYLRKGRKDEEVLMIVLNLTPNVLDYKIGVNEGTSWATVLNTDDQKYGGSGAPALVTDEEDDEWMYRPNAIVLSLPPLAAVVLRQQQKVSPPNRRRTINKSDKTLNPSEKMSLPKKEKRPGLFAGSESTADTEKKIDAKTIDFQQSKKPARQPAEPKAGKSKKETTKKSVDKKSDSAFISSSSVLGSNTEQKIDAKTLEANRDSGNGAETSAEGEVIKPVKSAKTGRKK